MTGNIVLPGDKLSTSEELLAGDGTFEEDGIIRANRMGSYEVDEKGRMAVVKPLTSIPILVNKGDVVLAYASSVRSMMVIAEVFHVTQSGLKTGKITRIISRLYDLYLFLTDSMLIGVLIQQGS